MPFRFTAPGLAAFRVRLRTPRVAGMKSLAVVLNSRAGRAQAVPREEMIARIRSAASWAELSFFDAGDGVVEAARAACSSGTDAVAVAGGDGTAAAVLDAARRSGCASIMVPLPLGTANMLPRRLYGDRDFESVLSELPAYETVTLHAGEAAGRTFYVALMAGAPVRFGQAREALRPAGSGRRLGEAAKRLRQGISSLAGSRLRLELDGAKQKLSRSGAVLVAPGGFAALRGEDAAAGTGRSGTLAGASGRSGGPGAEGGVLRDRSSRSRRGVHHVRQACNPVRTQAYPRHAGRRSLQV